MNNEKKISEEKQDGMFLNANHLVFELAKDLRRNMTDAEKLLWYRLKDGIHGLKFRRQHPINCYIADFYCHKLKLIIEIDGSIHDTPEGKWYDEQRENDLRQWGYQIIRFTNDDVKLSIEKVLLTIHQKVETLQQKSNSDLQ